MGYYRTRNEARWILNEMRYIIAKWGFMTVQDFHDIGGRLDYHYYNDPDSEGWTSVSEAKIRWRGWHRWEIVLPPIVDVTQH